MNNILTWEEYFMGVALLSAKRSKDPNTQVGTCIVSPDKIIIGVGYNGMPYCCSDDVFPWGRDGDYIDQKYLYVVHAELNAILNSNQSLEGATLYTTLFPCNECCKAVIQSKIKEIVFLCDKYENTDSVIAAKRMLSAANITYRLYKGRTLGIEVR